MNAPTLSDVINRLFSTAVAYPDHPAVVVRGLSISYAQFVDMVRRFATAFAITEEPRVAIALPQGAHAYAAMFGAALAGGYYVPLNIAAPSEKLSSIINQIDPHVIVASDSALGAALAREATQAIAISPEALDTFAPILDAKRRSKTGYVIFTSGSTGTPKGVVIPRSALEHYVDWLVTELRFTPEDRVAQHPNIAFDVSVMGIYGGLCSGATVLPVVGGGDRTLPARFIQRERLTVWISVPSVVDLIVRAHEATSAALGTVREFIFCGEPLLPAHLDALFAACPRSIVRNTYGPTEATVSVTSITLMAETCRAACGTTVALGDPIAGTGLHLIGGASENEGELVISGAQLATGYWNDPARTIERFKVIDVGGQAVRGYFTGDWVERRNGHLFFKERMDFQVKVRGFRVELDEVAAAIRDLGWPLVCVFKRNDGLAAIVERRDGATFDVTAMQKALVSKLEDYAIPSEIREIPYMPRNENDKVDRRAAIAWFDSRSG
jgi:D-alanine--poly(phosphoribitol) ligase subunit 1